MIGPRISMFGPPARLFEEPTVHVEVTPPEPEPEPEETIDEITDVSEQLALHSIISEERHTEILTRVNECQQRLEQLSQAESPSLAAIQREQQELRNELLSLKSLLVSIQSSLIQSPSTEPEPVAIVTETPVEPSPVESTEEPEQVEPLPENQPPKKKNRFI